MKSYTEIYTKKIVKSKLTLHFGEALIQYAKSHNIDNPKFIINTSNMSGRFLPHFKVLIKKEQESHKNFKIIDYEIEN